MRSTVLVVFIVLSLSGCAYIKSHEYFAAPEIVGKIVKNQLPVADAEIILKIEDGETIRVKTNENGNFTVGPIVKNRAGGFIFGATEVLFRYQLLISTGSESHVGIHGLGNWTTEKQLDVSCDLAKSAYPNAKHPIDLEQRCIKLNSSYQ